MGESLGVLSIPMTLLSLLCPLKFEVSRAEPISSARAPPAPDPLSPPSSCRRSVNPSYIKSLTLISRHSSPKKIGKSRSVMPPSSLGRMSSTLGPARCRISYWYRITTPPDFAPKAPPVERHSILPSSSSSSGARGAISVPGLLYGSDSSGGIHRSGRTSGF